MRFLYFYNKLFIRLEHNQVQIQHINFESKLLKRITFPDAERLSGNRHVSVLMDAPAAVCDTCFPLGLERGRESLSTDNSGNPQSFVGLEES